MMSRVIMGAAVVFAAAYLIRELVLDLHADPDLDPADMEDLL